MLLELTCPAEEGIEAASLRKSGKYESLREAILPGGWNVDVKPFEVRARGFVARSTAHLIRTIGFSSREVSTLCRTPATVVARCSFALYLASSTQGWSVPELLCLFKKK